jgi:hypothetical protein
MLDSRSLNEGYRYDIVVIVLLGSMMRVLHVILSYRSDRLTGEHDACVARDSFMATLSIH